MSPVGTGASGPHQGTPRAEAGLPLGAAKRAMILIHGRGATAEGILDLAQAFPHPDYAFVAPQAAGSTWYPERFLVPVEANEPYLSSALQRLGEELARVEASGIPAERTFLLGFSQGACLAAEFAARNPRRYAALAVLSGALIGDPEVPREEAGAVLARSGGAGLAGTPVFLGCGDHDPHIPRFRVEESAEILSLLGAGVTLAIYPGLGHTVSEPELAWVRSRMA